MSSILQGVFWVGSNPVNGATVRLWAKAQFADPGPAYDTAEPASGQVGSDVTTGTAHGGAGAWRFTGVNEGDYWLSINYGGHRTWEAVHVGAPEEVTAPNNLTAGAVSGIGTTETDVLSQTLTTPIAAGQCLAIGSLSLLTWSATTVIAIVRLYIAGTKVAEVTASCDAASNRVQVFGTTLTLLVPAAPSAAEDVTVYWGKLHTCDVSGTTIAADRLDLVMTGAAGYAAQEAANRPGLSDETRKTYAAMASRSLKAFQGASPSRPALPVCVAASCAAPPRTLAVPASIASRHRPTNRLPYGSASGLLSGRESSAWRGCAANRLRERAGDWEDNYSTPTTGVLTGW